jgi:hypothetical protein
MAVKQPDSPKVLEWMAIMLTATAFASIAYYLFKF